MERKIEDFDRVLVVEGYSDLLFYAEVLELVGKHSQVFIKELGGKSGLRAKLEAFVTPKLLERKIKLGFVFDADDDPEVTRRSLEENLGRLTGQRVEDKKWTDATPSIGLMVVPGESGRGEIETLVWKSWANDPANAAHRSCIEQYVSCMDAANARAHSPDKGLVGALLAIRNDEDPRLGPGARAKVFDLTRVELSTLRTFFAAF